MAGLFDRIRAEENTLNVHHFVAGIKGYGTGIWSRAQVLSRTNQLLEVPLDAAEEADYAAIADELDSNATALAKLGYGNQVEAAMVAAEARVINEAEWRSALEIS